MRIAATFKASYEDFSYTRRRVLLAPAACSRVTSERTVARVAGISEQDAADALADLAERSLAEHLDRAASLWTLHDVVRLFVRAQPEIRQADEAHLALAEEHVEAHRDPLDWLALEAGMDEVLTSVDRLLDIGGAERAASLIKRVDRHMRRRGRYTELLALYEQLVPSLVEGSEALAVALGKAGRCHRTLGNLPKAIEHHRHALALNEELGRLDGQAANLGNLGAATRIKVTFRGPSNTISVRSLSMRSSA